MNIENEVLRLLDEVLSLEGRSAGFGRETHLLGAIPELDSMAVVSMITALEDTFGIHKGQPVAKGHRLIFQAVYSMHALPYGPQQPVIDRASVQSAFPGQRFDPWVNRFYLRG